MRFDVVPDANKNCQNQLAAGGQGSKLRELRFSVRRRSGPQVRPHTGTAQRRVIHPVPVQEAVGRQLSLSVPVGRLPGRWYVEAAGRAVGGESEQRGRGFSWLFSFLWGHFTISTSSSLVCSLISRFLPPSA